jgi:hypothetical protein
MDVIATINRIKKVNALVREKRTGSPEEFATYLGISKRQLYNIFDFFKTYGAKIKYSRSLNTFYYAEKGFDMIIDFYIKPIHANEAEKINGGFFQNISSVQFHFTDGLYI